MKSHREKRSATNTRGPPSSASTRFHFLLAALPPSLCGVRSARASARPPAFLCRPRLPPARRIAPSVPSAMPPPLAAAAALLTVPVFPAPRVRLGSSRRERPAAVRAAAALRALPRRLELWPQRLAAVESTPPPSSAPVALRRRSLPTRGTMRVGPGGGTNSSNYAPVSPPARFPRN